MFFLAYFFLSSKIRSMNPVLNDRVYLIISPDVKSGSRLDKSGD